jgi:uncharacterized membrane protein YcfT
MTRDVGAVGVPTPGSHGQTSATTRYAWADDARGIAIALVVLGHTLSGIMAAGILLHSGASDSIYDFIYGFHMPLFFVVSGVFIPRSLARPHFISSKAHTLLYPYVLWSLIQGTLVMLSGASANNPTTARELLSGLIVDPLGQFWFLWVLFWLCVLIATTYRLHLTANAVLAVSMGLWLLTFWTTAFGAIGLVPRTICRYAIYFALGIRASDWLRTPHPTRTPILVGAAVTGVVGAWITREWRFNDGLAPVPAIMGVIAILATSYALEGRVTIINLMGRWSLPIYLGHVISAAGARIALLRLGVRGPAFHLLLGTTIGMSAPALLGWARDRGHFEFLFSPDWLADLFPKSGMEQGTCPK